MKGSPGEQLLNLCSSANSEVVLVAPFVKVSALKRILKVIPEGVPVICVARWRPEEIAAGVCDLEIFELIESRGNSQLLLHPLLHAKYFRADEECLVGSANLTLRALGWIVPSNLELLVTPGVSYERLGEFERDLYSVTFEATQTIRDEMLAAVESLRQKEARASVMLSEEAIADSASDAPEVDPSWLPSCPTPENLHRVYSGQGLDLMVNFQIRTAETDLKALAIPQNLSRKTFNSFVGASLRQMMLIGDVCNAAAFNPVSQKEGEALISEHAAGMTLPYSLEVHWDIIRNWIVYFLDDYRSSNGSLQKGRKL